MGGDLFQASGACWAFARVERQAALLVFGPLGTDDGRMLRALVGAVDSVVVDARLSGSDGVRFAVLHALTTPPAERRMPAIELCAPDGPIAAMALGLAAMNTTRVPLRLHLDRRQAEDHAARSAVARRLFQSLDAVAETRAWWASLRTALAADPSTAAGSIAVRLGWSMRGLQRRLADEATTFRAERHRARVEWAIERLLGGDQKIGAVARQAGFLSDAHFCRRFRAHTGQSPSGFRRVVSESARG